MENLYKRIRGLKLPKWPSKLPKKSEIESAMFSFSKKEWIAFFVLLAILLISTLIMLFEVNKSFMVSVPMKGGSISEGIMGTPRFVNPVLAFSDADRDLTTLIYSGLMRKDPDGNLIPDLAERYEASKDGLKYTFTLKDKLSFHDGKALSSDDVIFTINEVKDPIIKSPRRAAWDGITIEKISDKVVRFTLKQP